MRAYSSPRTGHMEPSDDSAPRAVPEDRQRGQALVEFAIILPVFFLLVAGMFDFGLGIYSDLTLVNAAREGARLGVIAPGNTSAVEYRVRAMAGNLDDSRLQVTVACERPVGQTFTACTDPMWMPGDATRVTVDYPVPHVLPAPLRYGDPPLVRSQDAHRVVRQRTKQPFRAQPSDPIPPGSA